MMSTTVVGRHSRRPADLAVGLCAALCLSPLGSLAASPDSPPQQRVKLDDLNLSDLKDAVTAYGRLHWAAVQVCPFADSSNYWLRESAQPCVQEAIGRAVQRIGSPRLTAYYRQRAPHETQDVQVPSRGSVR